MSNGAHSDTTVLLRAWANGDPAALERLTPRVYAELHRIAGSLMRREAPGRTLQPTALVNEAYLRLINAANRDWQSRAHFFAASARIMRHVLLDNARRRAAAKRGGGAGQVDLDAVPADSGGRAEELLALDRSLEALAEWDARKARVVELRFFGGLTVEETASVLEVSADTVARDWRLARAWLLTEMSG